MTAAIPSIDVDSQTDRIPDSIAHLGFLFLKSSSVPSPASIERMFEIAQEFFLHESPEEKAKIGYTTGNVGWIRVRQEKLDADVHPRGDIKEAFNMRPFDSNDIAQQPLSLSLARNQQDIAAFSRSCHQLCMRVLEALAESLNLAKDFFTSRHSYERPQGTILRLLYYPPTDLREADRGMEGDDIRAGAHSDYGSITLLFQKDVAGLQILLPTSGKPTWLDAPVVKDAILVNIGDLLDFWTGGKFKSTVHRVVLPRSEIEAGPRFSIAYFLHPDDDVLISRLITSTSEDETTTESDKRSIMNRFGVDPNAEPLTSKEWLAKRLEVTYRFKNEE
ncbi:hypothetical protein FRB93_009636 [Tulasnella sp. JGI-2019a]|nr:hypothetical protein FRB93_009636 [Tulasnella sp. JGI-2019a]